MRRPKNPIGRIFLVVWFSAAGVFALLPGVPKLVELAGDAPGAPGRGLDQRWAWVPFFTLLLTYSFLLFPEGRPASPRRRPVAWGIAGTSAPGRSFALNSYSDCTNPNIEHVHIPFASSSLTR